MSIKNNEIDKYKNTKQELLKIGRGVVAALLLSSHLMPLIVTATELDIEGEQSSIENVVGIKDAAELSPAALIPSPEPVEDVEDNLLVDGTFDDSTTEDSIWGSKDGLAGYDLEGDLVGHIPSNTNNAHILQVVDTTPGGEYTFSADVFVENDIDEPVGGSFFTAKPRTANNGQGPVLSQIDLQDTKGDWQRVEITFTANSEQTFVGIVKWVEGNNPGAIDTRIYMDNATLTGEPVEEQEVEYVDSEGFELIWQDDFTEEDLNQSNWGYELGNIRGNEMQHYSSSKDNVYIEDGKLILQATDRPEEDQYRNTEKWGSAARQVKYNSGSVRTHGKQDFLYGRIEAKMKLPKGKGAFPAFWTLGSDFHLDGRISETHGYGWPQTGEIDIMEMIGAPTEERSNEVASGGTSNKNTHGTAHFYYEHVNDVDGDGAYGYKTDMGDGPYRGANIGGQNTIEEDYNDDFHVFGINWSPDKIEWYVDGIIFNTLTFEDPTDPDNQARLDAAKLAFNRPHYIQLNLATGGNWAGDAGDYLGVDETKLEIDWVRWSQNEEQQQASTLYYENAPQINGVEDLTFIQGEKMNFLENVSTNLEDYIVDYSIENEYMYENTGGRNEVSLLVENSEDIEGIENLEPGVYNIHYTALPENAEIEGPHYPVHRTERKSAVVTILPRELIGVEGEALANISLPEGMEWVDSEQLLGSSDVYTVIYRRLLNSGTEESNERKVFVNIRDSKISREVIDDGETPVEDEGLKELENRIAKLEELVNALALLNSELSDEITQIKAELEELRDELVEATEMTSSLEERVKALEDRLAELEEADEVVPSEDEITPGETGDSTPGKEIETTPGVENETTPGNTDEDAPSEKGEDLPDTGEANTLASVLGGLSLIAIGGALFIKTKKEA